MAEYYDGGEHLFQDEEEEEFVGPQEFTQPAVDDGDDEVGDHGGERGPSAHGLADASTSAYARGHQQTVPGAAGPQEADQEFLKYTTVFTGNNKESACPRAEAPL